MTSAIQWCVGGGGGAHFSARANELRLSVLRVCSRRIHNLCMTISKSNTNCRVYKCKCERASETNANQTKHVEKQTKL